ncbi:hypothetical protein [Rhodopirellula sp. MGV]|uniref:hypothetical protein n=1 Tax=Rhodopirellula sp. MGV TaxID=2023130 RepID=UPI000B974B5E|nr:hypothetical protein [Rhodopirellula sp. MGV]OYP35461.1 hypothetical protein CGZ80_11505 [Rhodopirellula sp. MGV]PNY33901.1 hypothetical protein C2E31_26130 [Rhodopirellula baltica]
MSEVTPSNSSGSSIRQATFNQPAGPNRFIYFFSAIVLCSVVAYYLFAAINTNGLPTHQGTATVLDKYFQEGGTSSFTQPIGNQQIVRVTETPEAYVVKLEINEQQTDFPLDKEVYDRVSAGDTLSVEYQITRLTGSIRVTKANP